MVTLVYSYTPGHCNLRVDLYMEDLMRAMGDRITLGNRDEAVGETDLLIRWILEQATPVYAGRGLHGCSGYEIKLCLRRGTSA